MGDVAETGGLFCNQCFSTRNGDGFDAIPSLSDIAGAGFGQWARQWILLNRREPFSDENPGEHKLLMSFGGSAGHCGAIALDVQEGLIKEGRVWRVSVSKLSEIREQRENEREERKRMQEQITRENHRVAILKSIKRFPNGETKTLIRNAANLNPKYFEPVLQDLISSQEIEPCQFDRGEFKKDGTVRTYAGFRIVDPASRGTRTQKNTEEHTRTVFQCSSAETDEDT